MSSRPRILVTGGSANVSVAEGFLPSHYVGQGYVRAVAEGGGVPLVVANVDGFEDELASEMIDGADGLLLTGGTDLSPATYGQLIDEDHTHDPDPPRDRFEIALIREARKHLLPILGICRGFQMLNVAYGGTLNQHRPHQDSNIIEHPNLRIELTDVTLASDSKVARVVGAEHVEVYCLHHQAIDQVGSGLRATGVASDGLIESLEDPVEDFVLGVLWHPEQMLERDHARAIYGAFLSAAGVRA